MIQRIGAASVLAALAIVFLIDSSPASRAVPGPVPEPQYDGNGDLKRPADFQSWIFVGANIGLQYRRDTAEKAQREQDTGKRTTSGDFHNIYIRPEAYEEYRKTGKFPDMTMLVMDVYQTKERDEKNIVLNGLFPGKQRAIEVAVKNSKRPDGLKTDWAYYVFDPPTTPTAKAFRDSACYDCHLKHASVDNVWVQFYPVLRDREEREQK
jgi:Cytochrome P460